MHSGQLQATLSNQPHQIEVNVRERKLDSQIRGGDSLDIPERIPHAPT